MTLSDIKNSIFRRTQTNATTFPAADMVLAINSAAERVHSLIRRHLDNFRPTSWTSSDLSTGTAEPKFDALFHDLIALWPSYQRAVERNLPSAAGFLMDIQRLEKEIVTFYGARNYEVFTVTIASPGVITKKAHGLQSGDRVSFVTTGALPTGLSVDTFYYVVSPQTDTFRVSSTKDGTAIDTSGTQSGTHYYVADTQRRMKAAYHDTR